MVAASPPWTCPSPLGPRLETLPAGSNLWRVHSAVLPPDGFNPYGAYEKVRDAPTKGAPGRFDSITGDFGYLYAGATRKVTVAEAFIRGSAASPFSRYVPFAAVLDASLARLATTQPLRLVSVHGDGLARLGQDAWLTSCDEFDYRLTEEWAAAIRRWSPDAQGLIWRSKRANDGMAYVLFGDRISTGCIAVLNDQQLGVEPGLSLVVRLLEQMGLALDARAAGRP